LALAGGEVLSTATIVKMEQNLIIAPVVMVIAALWRTHKVAPPAPDVEQGAKGDQAKLVPSGEEQVSRPRPSPP
jgi:uncharacterized membrane protein YadS